MTRRETREKEVRLAAGRFAKVAADARAVASEHVVGTPPPIDRLTKDELEVAIALNLVLADINDAYVEEQRDGLLDAHQLVFDELFRRKLPRLVHDEPLNP